MKNTALNKTLTAATTLLGLLSSCAKEPVENLVPDTQTKETVTIHLSAPATKTSLQDDKAVLWSAGDKVVINHAFYDVQVDPEDPAVATVENVEKADEYIALSVYQYRTGTGENQTWHSFMDFRDSYYYTCLPQSQPWSQNSFYTYANPIVAYSKDTNLSFTNLNAVIKVGLTGNGEKISAAKLLSNSSLAISGYIKISEGDIRDGNLSDYAIDTEIYRRWSYIDVTCPDDEIVLSATPVWFYFSVMPFSDESGFTFVVEDENGSIFSKTKTDAFSVSRGEIKEMEPLEYKSFKKIEMIAGEPSPISVSVNAKAETAATVRYVAVLAAAWDDLMGSSDWTEQTLAEAILNSYECQYSRGGDFVMNFTDAYNGKGHAMAIAAETSYKIIAQYSAVNMGVGNCSVFDVTTSAATGEAPALDVSITSTEYDKIHSLLKTNAAVVSACLLTKTEYESHISSGNTDAGLIKEYGFSLSDEEIARAKADGCELIWSGLVPFTDYVVLVAATSVTGMETIDKKNTKTDFYIFNPATTVLETVSTKATFATDLFLAFDGLDLTLSPVTLKKVPGMDVFVLEDIFKGNEKLAELGYQDEAGTFLTIIDARNRNAVEIRFDVNRFGIKQPQFLGFNRDFSFGCHVTYYTGDSVEDYPLGVYDAKENTIKVGSLVFGNTSQVYDKGCKCTITWPKSQSLSIEDFSKTQSNW